MKEILKEDAELVEVRIKELKQELKQELRSLADEFRQTLGESSETWHDNSPWDNVKAKEAVLLAELENIQKVKKTYLITKEGKTNPIGQTHEVEFNGNKVKIFLAGDFSLRTGQKIDGYTVVTKDSPIAQALLGI